MITKNYRTFTKYLIMCIVATPRMSHAQDVPRLIELYFTEVRAGKYPSIPKQLTMAENSKEVLDRIIPYSMDTAGTLHFFRKM